MAPERSGARGASIRSSSLSLLLAFWLYGRGLRQLWTRAGSGRGVAYSSCSIICSGRGRAVRRAGLTARSSGRDAALGAHGPTRSAGRRRAAAAPLRQTGHRLRLGAAGRWRREFLGSTSWRLSDSNWATPSRGRCRRRFCTDWRSGSGMRRQPFNPALASYGVHALEHVSFFGTALLFWRVILDARLEPARRPGAGRELRHLDAWRPARRSYHHGPLSSL